MLEAQRRKQIPAGHYSRIAHKIQAEEEARYKALKAAKEASPTVAELQAKIQRLEAEKAKAHTDGRSTTIRHRSQSLQSGIGKPFTRQIYVGKSIRSC